MKKEWNPAVVKEGGAVLELRKRKATEMLEHCARRSTEAKSRRIDEEKTVLNESRTRSIHYLGAKQLQITEQRPHQELQLLGR